MKKLIANNKDFRYISDNSCECDKETAFFVTSYNKKYIDDAKAKGSSFFIEPKELKQIFEIEDGIKIVGVTGTNGKTTTAAAIYSILLDLNEYVALQGTRGFFINDEKMGDKSLTTPPLFETLCNIKEAKQRGCKYFIMEVSSHAISQKRIEQIEFALKVFTNISQDHLDYHKNMTSYIKTKSSFFQDESLKLINKDDKKLSYNLKNCYTYGIESGGSFSVGAYSLENGVSAVIKHFDDIVSFNSGVFGFFNLYNLTAAVASAKLISKHSLEAICEAVENFAGVSGRMEVVSVSPFVIVDFAHTPDGMEKVLDSLKSKELIVVFGAGGDRDRSKRALMAKAAQRFAKKIYITNDNPRSEDPLEIISDIVQGIEDDKKVLVVPDRKKAIKLAIDEAKENDCVIILGKGDEEFIEIKDKKIPHNDKEWVLEVLGQ